MDNYKLLTEFILRTPQLPFSTLDQNFSTIKTEENFISTLKEYYNKPIVKESVYLASPNLCFELNKWFNNEISGDKEIKRLQFSLFRYLIRMSTRCTPFGLFSGVNVGEWKEQTLVSLSPASSNKRCTHLDMDLIDALVRKFVNHEESRSFLRFFPNTSLYSFEDEIRYVEYSNISGRKYKISSIEKSEYVLSTLNAAKGGAYFESLTGRLVDDEISIEDASEFINAMIDNQLLISELEPTLTDDKNLLRLLDTIGAIHKNRNTNNLCHWKTTLEDTVQTLQRLDTAKNGNEINEYTTVADSLKSLNVNVDLKKFVQVNLIKACDSCTISYYTAGAIRKSIEVLNQLMPNLENQNLNSFKNAFVKRFEEQEISLLQVLDTELGLGYPFTEGSSSDIAPLIDDIPTHTVSQLQSLSWNRQSEFLLSKYLAARTKNEYKIIIEDRELETFAPNWDDIPDTIAIMGSFIGNTSQADNNLKVLLSGVGGTSAANLMGRFTHIDQNIHAVARSITDLEQELNPNAIYAEILHLPEARTGNILLRAKLRDYEIPFLSKPSVPNNQQIHLQDLLVSVKNERIFLRSKKLNKEIIPCLTTAHNYQQNSLPVYRFLCDLQSQKVRANLTFSWGGLSDYYKFLPRVEYKSVILSRASWQFESDEIKTLIQADTPLLLKKEVAFWRDKWCIPRYITIAEGDNELFIDLENRFYVELLIEEVKKAKKIILKEFLFSPSDAVVNDEKGQSYTNEFIATFAKRKLQQDELQATLINHHANVTREFALGSEWLYYKLYTGEKTSDKILSSNIAFLIKDLKEQNLIDKWFFIRYNDPEFHIRLRLNLKDQGDIGRVVNKVHSYLATLHESDLIWKIQTDVYQREIERYGANTIPFIEEIFSNDSDCTLTVLRLINDLVDEDEVRWLYALKAMDAILNHFGYTLEDKIVLLNRVKNNFLDEFGGEQITKKIINKKYRKYYEKIHNVLRGKPSNNYYPEEWTKAEEVLKNQLTLNKPNIDKILLIKNNGGLEVGFDTIVWSIIHMMINRLLRSKHRKHEMVLYNFMHKYYQTELKLSVN